MSEAFKHWIKSDDKIEFWRNFLGNYYDVGTAKCLSAAFEYFGDSEDDLYIIPIITRSIFIIKGGEPGINYNFNKKFDDNFYCNNISVFIDYITLHLQNKIKLYLPRKSERFDPEAEACADLAKEVAEMYQKTLRKQKLERVTDEQNIQK